MVFDVGGGKIQSSSDLVRSLINYTENRPWGFFENLLEAKDYKVKKLVIKPKKKLASNIIILEKKNGILLKVKEKFISIMKYLGAQKAYISKFKLNKNTA